MRLVALFAGAHRIARLFPVSEPHAVCFFLSLGFLFLSNAGTRVRWMIAGASLAGVLADYRVRDQLVHLLKLWPLEPPASLVTFIRCNAGQPLTLVVLALGLEAFSRAGGQRSWVFRTGAVLVSILWPWKQVFQNLYYYHEPSDFLLPFLLLGLVSGSTCGGALLALRDRHSSESPRPCFKGEKMLLAVCLLLFVVISASGVGVVLDRFDILQCWLSESTWLTYLSTLTLFGFIVFFSGNGGHCALPKVLWFAMILVIAPAESPIYKSISLGPGFCLVTLVVLGMTLHRLANDQGASSAASFKKGALLTALWGLSTFLVGYAPRTPGTVYYFQLFFFSALTLALTLAFGYFLVGSLSWLVQLARGQGFTHREDRSACPTSHLSPSKPEAPQDAQLGCRKISCV